MKITIGHLYPDLLNLYGDRGNIQSLKMRCQWRGIEAEVKSFQMTDKIDLSGLDIVLLGGGSDREQKLVSEALQAYKKELQAYVDDHGVMLALCGGYELLGQYCDNGKEKLPGLDLAEMHTEHGEKRLISNVVLENTLFDQKIVGFENHAGRVITGNNQAFGKVLLGHGNDGKSGMEGIMYKNIIGTNLHGPLLPKNPQVCDYILKKALERKYGEAELSQLDDRQELAANQYMVERLGV